jgi:basic amino acid/polyamine antiporter, APA family
MRAPAREALPRRLGLVGALAVVIGSTIGSGIFRSPAAIASRLPSPVAIIAVWAAGGALALCGALTLAEVAGALPRTGGIYVIIREGWGALPAFLFGWTELIVIRAAALGAVATTFAEYVFRMFGYDPTVAPYTILIHDVAAIAIVALALVNIVGVRASATVLELTTIAKYGALLFIVGAVIYAKTHGLGPTAPVSGNSLIPGSPSPMSPITAGAFGLALVSVLWAYDGWADLSFVAGEVADPARTIPVALIAGTLAVIVIYIAANLAYLAVLPPATMRTSNLVAADVAHLAVGHWGVVLIGIAVVLATIGTLNASLLTAPRIFFAMADDGLLFRPIAAIHPRFQTPYVAIALSATLGVLFVLTRTFEQLADTFITAIVPFYALGVAAVFRLRRQPAYRPPYRVPGYPVVPALFVVAAVWILASAIADHASRIPTLAVLGVTLAGIPVYRLVVRRP